MPWGAAIGAAATIGGGLLSSKSNKDAAAQAGQAQLEAARIQAEATEKQIAELRRQYDVSNQRLDEARESGIRSIRLGSGLADEAYGGIVDGSAAAPAYMRSVMADPGRLTMVQQEGLEEARRGTMNALRGSSLAGSGRTAAAIFKDVEGNYINSALEANRARAGAAAAGLSDVFFNAQGTRAQNKIDQGKSEANVELGIGTSLASNASNLGSQVGNALASQGAYTAGAAANAGNINANATAANGAIGAGVLGDLGGIIAAETRRSRYDGGNVFKKNGV